MSKVLMKGNEAIAQAAINAGCMCYFGYPITPQNEIGEYMSSKMIEMGRTYISAESELAAVNMLIGAGSTGTLAMTSSSSCAIALMQEGISSMATAEIPGVIVSVMRAGPGLGDITPSQADYTQSVKGGGNGDYRTIVLAPSTINEAVILTQKAFYLSMKYRNPAMLLADGILGQMMEPVEMPEGNAFEIVDTSSWALEGTGDGDKTRDGRSLMSLHMGDNILERLNHRIFKKYVQIEQNETMFENYLCDDADIIIAAFGTVARVAKSAVNSAREKGIKVGLFRPITLWPFPYDELNKCAKGKKYVLDIELNMGQMLQDVKVALDGCTKTEFFGKTGGAIINSLEIYNKIIELSKEGQYERNTAKSI